MRDNRAGFVRFQQDLARGALFRGNVGGARIALRVLQTNDFAGGAAVSETFLNVLRDSQSTDEAVLAAARTLADLGPAGWR
jgi:hypothetical protein